MKKLILALALLATPAYAQAPAPAPAAPVNSCNLLTILKGLTATNFLDRIQTCNAEDMNLAIADAQAQVPADNASLACYQPLQVIIANVQKGGAIYKLQLFRDAKRAGLIVNCLAWFNGTIGVQ